MTRAGVQTAIDGVITIDERATILSFNPAAERIFGFTSAEIGGPYPLKIVIADEAGVPIVPELNGQIETGQPAPDLPKALSVKVLIGNSAR